LSAVIDTLRRRKLALLDPQNWDDRNDRRFMQLYKEAKGLSSLYAMCAARCHDTYYHWRVFTPGPREPVSNSGVIHWRRR
jgi:hypothetical protein